MNATSNSRKSLRSKCLGVGLLFIALALTAGGFGNSNVMAAGPGQNLGSSNQGNAPSAIVCPGTPAQCFADVAPGSPFFDFSNHVYQQGIVSGYPCGGAGEPCDSSSRPYYRPGAGVTRGQMSKFTDNARTQPGMVISDTTGIVSVSVESSATIGFRAISHAANYGGVYGTGTGAGGYGLYGDATANLGRGVIGVGSGTNAVGVDGAATGPTGSQTGVRGTSVNGYGVEGVATGGGNGIVGIAGTGYAGSFIGNVHVTGTCCSMAAGTTSIDNPTDPANKYLNQALVESPDMKSIVDGNATTDAAGEAVVILPAYFQAATGDYRYQLTVVGQFAQAIVSSELKDSHFTIKTDKPNVKVSWQVTGIRQDPYAKAHPIQVVQDKPAAEQGKYLHPIEQVQPESKGIGYEEQQKLQQQAPFKGGDR